MKYIALLRGINVGRHKRIKMADLIKTFESIGFENVKTYLQSGNIIFEYNTVDEAKIAEEIKAKISEAFEFSVNVIIRTDDELENIVDNNPFVGKNGIALDKLHVTFLADIPDPEIISNLDINKDETERFEVINREVYLYCPNGYGRTKLTNDVFEKKLNTAATTRNWKTTNRLLEMSKLEK